MKTAPLCRTFRVTKWEKQKASFWLITDGHFKWSICDRMLGIRRNIWSTFFLLLVCQGFRDSWLKNWIITLIRYLTFNECHKHLKGKLLWCLRQCAKCRFGRKCQGYTLGPCRCPSVFGRFHKYPRVSWLGRYKMVSFFAKMFPAVTVYYSP